MKKFLAVKLMRSSWVKILFLILFTIYDLRFTNVFALSPETKLVDEAQEQRAMNLFLQVRCLVCNGQVIENSDTEFSFEMRKLIREKIAKGESDEEIKTELVKEFGENILTEPQNFTKIFLWLMPAIFALAGIFLLLRSARN